MNTQAATINVPLTGIKPLYRNDEDDTLVLEVKMDKLKDFNTPQTLDEIISRAELDYAMGDYESFDDVEDLINDLKS